MRLAACICLLLCSASPAANAQSAMDTIDARAAAVEQRVIDWRRDIHQHPELGNREFRTAGLVADHLRSLGLKVQTGVAHTGVVALLEGSRPGPVVLLRADMDALPVTERVDLPFASRATAIFEGKEVGVMHACGHDTHVAILMGVAEVLAGMREQVPGTVKFVFQPAEEGPPLGEEGGAKLMVQQGVLDNPKVDAAFALHVNSVGEVGTIAVRPGGTMASAEDFRIVVKGKQTHGAYPWAGVDPILTASHIVVALQAIVSRGIDVSDSAAVVTVGSIHGGNRSNIIPETVELVGTMRALTPANRDYLRARVRAVAEGTASAMGATVELSIPLGMSYPVTFNHPELTARMLPTLQRVAGAGRVVQPPAVTGAEDFSFFAERVPGLYFSLGGRPTDVAPQDAPAHHTPDFFVDERALLLGVRAMAALAVDYLTAGAGNVAGTD